MIFLSQCGSIVPPSVTPISVSTCVCWLDASDSITFTPMDGYDVLLSWADKSGLGNNGAPTQIAGTDPPFGGTPGTTNSKQSLHFINSGTVQANAIASIAAVGGTDSSALLVIDPSAVADGQVFFGLNVAGSGTTYSIKVFISGTAYAVTNGGGTLTNGTASTSIVCIGYTAATAMAVTTVKFYINGVEVTSGTLDAVTIAGQVSLAGLQSTDTLACDVCDFVLYDKELSGAEITNLYDNYFKPKWGLP